ncbi:MAG TPA: ATP-binding protein [Myxococcales bacterium]|jgi:signal transduction histidine kinase|nr:ATP-binding protein [Myxococcales bacterium]HZX93632.1 ATP-binding protein [Myxococcales bacterium]
MSQALEGATQNEPLGADAANAPREHDRAYPARDRDLLAGRGPYWSVLSFCAFETAFYFAYRYGMSFSLASASPFWFPDSVLLCALLLIRPASWWIPLAGTLPIRLFSPVAYGTPPWFLLVTFAIDSAKGVLTALALRRFIKNPLRFETIRDFSLFCLWAVLIIPGASAFAGAAARRSSGVGFWASWEDWLLGDALAHLVVTPAILYWMLGTAWKAQAADTRRWLERGLLTVGLIVAGYVAFETPSGFAERFYLPVPFLFWAAIRFGMSGASGAIAVIAFLSVNAALSGRGPFLGQTPEETALALQHFLLVRAVPLYLIAILIEQKAEVDRQLQQQRDQFAHLSRVSLLGELSGSLAHELNQPLTAILANAQAAERFIAEGRGDQQDLREILGDIVEDDRRAGEIIRGLRQMFNRHPVRQQDVDLNGVVRDVVKLARSEISGASVELRTELCEGLPVIRGERVQLQQLLLNLVTNACNALSHTARRQLTVRTGLDGGGVRVTVSDSGQGIAAGDLPHIFDHFFTTRPEGMGLGLAVCSTIVAVHGGRLWAENNPAGGASFHFVLPRPADPTQEPAAATRA